MGLTQHARLLSALGPECDSPTAGDATAAAAAASLRGGGDATDENNRSGREQRRAAGDDAPSGWSVGPSSPGRAAVRAAPGATASEETRSGDSSSVFKQHQQQREKEEEKPPVWEHNCRSDATATGLMELAAPEFGRRRRDGDDGVLADVDGDAETSGMLNGPQRGHAGDGRRGGMGTTGEMPAAMTATVPTRMASSSPVLSLSGHLISPEVRRGEGGGEVKKWARDAFMDEAVVWDKFSRFPEVSFVVRAFSFHAWRAGMCVCVSKMRNSTRNSMTNTGDCPRAGRAVVGPAVFFHGRH